MHHAGPLPALRRPRRRAAWLGWTLLLLVLATLAPGVSRAVQAARGAYAPWSVVCSAPTASAADPVARSTATNGLVQSGDHCPLCGLPGAWAPPPAPALMPPAPAAGRLLPPLFLHAPRPLHAWGGAQARAPPQAS